MISEMSIDIVQKRQQKKSSNKYQEWNHLVLKLHLQMDVNEDNSIMYILPN